MTTIRASRLLLVGALLVLMASCGPRDGDEAPTAEDPPGGSVTDVTVHPGTAEDYVGARGDVRDVTCEQDGGQWVASGSVTNPTDEEADYRIYVSFLDAERQTRGLLQVDVEGVGVDETESWSGGLDVGGEDLDCVLRVERSAPSDPDS